MTLTTEVAKSNLWVRPHGALTERCGFELQYPHDLILILRANGKKIIVSGHDGIS